MTMSLRGCAHVRERCWASFLGLVEQSCLTYKTTVSTFSMNSVPSKFCDASWSATNNLMHLYARRLDSLYSNMISERPLDFGHRPLHLVNGNVPADVSNLQGYCRSSVDIRNIGKRSNDYEQRADQRSHLISNFGRIATKIRKAQSFVC